MADVQVIITLDTDGTWLNVYTGPQVSSSGGGPTLLSRTLILNPTDTAGEFFLDELLWAGSVRWFES